MFQVEETHSDLSLALLDVAHALHKAHANIQTTTCAVTAYLNLGYGGRRKVLIAVDDDGDCYVLMSRIFDTSAAAAEQEEDPGPMRLVLSLNAKTPNLAQQILERIRLVHVESL